MVDSRTIFKKIIDGDIPGQVVYQDEVCLAFHDIAPQSPVHLLLIPKEEIPSLDELGPEDQALVGHMLLVIPKLAKDLGLNQGYRVVINTGEEGGQTVPICISIC